MDRKEITPALQVWSQDLCFMGIELGTRMTVIDLDGNGTLFVHSPIKLSNEIRSQLDSLGKVKYVVAPNKWHHLFINEYRNAYPEAQLFCAPGLEKKRADIMFDRVIDDSNSFPWNPTIEHQVIQGAPLFNEVAFFHKSSKTLVLTDTALHICKDSPWKTKLFFAAIGTYNKFGLSRLEKWLFIKDKVKFNTSMEKIAKWDFDKILLAHGNILESGGKEAFISAYL